MDQARLRDRHLRIVQMAQAGDSVKEIAYALGVSEIAVAYVLDSPLTRLGLVPDEAA